MPKHSDLCAASGDLVNAACFEKDGNGFGWLQGTSVAAPNLTGVAALVLSARPELRGNPDGLLARLQSTARHGLVNATGPNDPGNTAAGASGTPCPSGYCHLDYAHPIPFAQAYGAGLVDARRPSVRRRASSPPAGRRAAAASAGRSRRSRRVRRRAAGPCTGPARPAARPRTSPLAFERTRR